MRPTKGSTRRSYLARLSSPSVERNDKGSFVLSRITQPAALLLYIGANMIGGPLGEELGWCGFALDRLQNKWHAVVASLILGITLI